MSNEREPLTLGVQIPENVQDGELQLMGVLDNACRIFRDSQGTMKASPQEISRAAQWLASKWDSPF